MHNHPFTEFTSRQPLPNLEITTAIHQPPIDTMTIAFTVKDLHTEPLAAINALAVTMQALSDYYREQSYQLIRKEIGHPEDEEDDD